MEDVMKKMSATLFAVVFMLVVFAGAGEMAKAKTLKGWVSDSECAAKGDKKCSNKDHIAQGAKLVLVTDGDGKIWTVENPDKLAAHQGHYVQVKATTDADKSSVNVKQVTMLKEPSEAK
jgi:hypothetical protein